MTNTYACVILYLDGGKTKEQKMKISMRELEVMFLRKVDMLMAMGFGESEAKAAVKSAMFSAVKLMNR